MRVLRFKEISQASGGNYTPNALELSGAGSLFFGLFGGMLGGALWLTSPAPGLAFQATEAGAQIILNETLPLPVLIMMGIGAGATIGSLLGLSLYSLGFELID